MKHALRKYLSNRGSALFMVLSLMTALMVLVMAMYFSIVSSREVQVKVFNQEQAYRSSVNIAEAIAAGLDKYSWKQADGSTVTFETLLTSMTPDGPAITTGANGFEAFGATGTDVKLEDENLGAYTVSIDRLQDEDDKMVFDIAVTTSVGGVVETSHTFLYIEQPKGENDQGDNIFTSTGYVPNDTYLDNGFYATDIFCDTENTVVGSYTGNNIFMGNLYTGGSLSVNIPTQFWGDTPKTLAIRGNLNYNITGWGGTHISGSGYTSGSNVDLGTVMVGGDYIIPDNHMFKGCDIYVNGDLILGGVLSDINNVFVKGNIIFTTGTQSFGGAKVHLYDGSDPEIKSPPSKIIAADGSELEWTNFGAIPWTEASAEAANGMYITDFLDRLGELTESEDYAKWELDPAKLDLGVQYDKDTTDIDGDGDKEEYLTFPKKGADGKYLGNPVTVTFTQGEYGVETPDDDVLTDLPDNICTYYFDWQGKSVGNYFPDGSALNYSAVTIEDVIVKTTGSGWGYNNTAIIFDTGKDPSNQYIVNLIPNRDTDNDGTNDTFIWKPKSMGDTDVVNILTRGNGSLIIRIPNGMTYQDINFTPTMHETWFAILGGDIYRNNIGSFTDRVKVNDETEDGNGDGLSIYVDNMMYDSSLIRQDGYEEIRGFIHTECAEGCSKCNYSEDKGEKCSVCKKAMTVYKCAEHNVTYEYCADETCSAYDPPLMYESGGTKKPYGLCINRIEPDAVSSMVNSMSSTEEYNVIGGTNFKLPNCNIFLVSCDENADIRLSTHADGTLIMQNKFFGFVYAPYMTFKAFAQKGTSGGAVRLCGGLIVSDYIISDYHSLVMCYPTYLPGDMMDKNSAMLASNDNKDWKVTIAGH